MKNAPGKTQGRKFTRYHLDLQKFCLIGAVTGAPGRGLPIDPPAPRPCSSAPPYPLPPPRALWTAEIEVLFFSQLFICMGLLYPVSHRFVNSNVLRQCRRTMTLLYAKPSCSCQPYKGRLPAASNLAQLIRLLDEEKMVSRLFVCGGCYDKKKWENE